MIIGSVVLLPITLISPLTLVVAGIFTFARAAWYAKTHTTIKSSDNKKFYVRTSHYQEELQKTFTMEAENRPSPAHKDLRAILNQYQNQELKVTHTTTQNLIGSALNTELRIAFANNDYKTVIKYIGWGANHNRMFHVAAELNGELSVEFGCLYAFVCKRLKEEQRESVRYQDLMTLYELLVTKEALPATHLIEAHYPISSLIKEAVSYRHFNREKALEWINEANADDLYALHKRTPVESLATRYLEEKSNDIELNELNRFPAEPWFNYYIGTASALASHVLKDWAPEGGNVTSLEFNRYDYPKPNLPTKSASNVHVHGE